VSVIDVGPLAALPERGARCVRVGGLTIAVFRTSTGEVFALRDRCPHRGGPLSQGIVHGTRVTCPLHDWVIDLTTGRATGVDEGATATFAARVVDGRVLLELPAELLAKAS
jgi:nitrite reductase (NADH) small subunit